MKRCTFLYGILGTLSMLLLACGNKPLLFEQVNAERSGIYFVNRIVDNEAVNILTYPYLFNGAGVGIADFDHDGWEDIFLVGNQRGSNRLYRNKENFQFDDLSDKAGIKGKSDWSTGVNIVDLNADGWADIYISTVDITGMFHSRNELYLNNQDGTFSECAEKYGLDFKGHNTQSLFFDYDNDGDLDCFLLNHAATYEEGYKTIAARTIRDSISGSRLLQNEGTHFIDRTAEAGIYSSSIGYGLGIAMGDLNNDGWMDLYVSNDFKENDYCYINNQDGTFKERSDSLFGHQSRFSMGNDIADINNDGWQDVFTLDMLSPDEKILKTSVADDDIGIYDYKRHYGFGYQFSKNCLQLNRGGNCFSETALQLGIAATDWSWAPLFADFDNDGNKDLFVSNGYRYRTNDLDFNNYIQGVHSRNQQLNLVTNKFGLVSELPPGKTTNYFFLNKDEDGFQDRSQDAGFTIPTLSNGCAFADLDRDGRLDLVINRINEPVGIYRNQMPAGNYIDITLHGEKGNSSGIGTMIYCYSRGGVQCFAQSTTRGFMSSVSPIIHVGTGKESIDSLFILWPSGVGEWLKPSSGVHAIRIEEANALPMPRLPELRSYIDPSWRPADILGDEQVVHREDDFDDQDVQPFLLHSIATQGPKLTSADVNGDGLGDFYICGAKGQPGSLLLQRNDGTFHQHPSPDIQADSLFEDSNAIFFDADNDGDADLYVTSGGNEYFGHQRWLKDRLYLNNGEGSFTRKDDLPELFENKSCARACDFDKDGDLDLFVGGRVNARMYGYMPASVILQNEGRAQFKEVTEKIAPDLLHVGMVTDAAWVDYDQDGWTDLLIVGEWMPVTVYKNRQGRLVRVNPESLAYSNGLWNCLYPADLDADGDTDFLLGNWGTNSKLKASPESPLKMYLSDWDQNGETEPLLAIKKSNQYYPFLVKTDLEKRLPYLRKRFLKFSDMAGKNMSDIFGQEALDKARLLQAYELSSSVLWNEGGTFRLQALPGFLQVSPIFCFSETGEIANRQYMAAGNFFGVQPYEGRYDALMPAIFDFEGKQAVLRNYLLLNGEVRDIKSIVAAHKQLLLVARNNDKLVVYEKN